jgi:hypothetical protein
LRGSHWTAPRAVLCKGRLHDTTPLCAFVTRSARRTDRSEDPIRAHTRSSEAGPTLARFGPAVPHLNVHNVSSGRLPVKSATIVEPSGSCTRSTEVPWPKWNRYRSLQEQGPRRVLGPVNDLRSAALLHTPQALLRRCTVKARTAAVRRFVRQQINSARRPAFQLNRIYYLAPRSGGWAWRQGRSGRAWPVRRAKPGGAFSYEKHGSTAEGDRSM